jgi:hypothetical protein
MQAELWAVAIGAALLVVVAGLADRRRARRRDLDRAGWVPWPLIMVLAMIVAAAAVALAIKT